jgi:hypothetical protein
MRHWTFWEWVAHAALFVAAIIVATDTGLRLSPDLAAHFPTIHSPWWGFAPAALVVISTLILLLREFVFSRPSDVVPYKVTDSSLSKASEAVPAAKGERIFVNEKVTPDYLQDFFRDHTAMQAENLLKPFVGKWMKVSGSITNVTGFSSGVTLAVRESNKGLIGLFLYFGTEWIDHLAILRRGDEVHAIGKITKVDSLVVVLEDCELVDPPERDAKAPAKKARRQKS